jgi:hypothetical protein
VCIGLLMNAWLGDTHNQIISCTSVLTHIGAALALLHTIGPERVPSGQVVLAAYDREQARIAFEEASGIVCADKRIVAAR